MENFEVNPDKKYKLFTDGGSRGNPGKAACAWVVYAGDQEVLHGSKYLGMTTNNDAEYQGLIEGLETCIRIGIKKLECYSDSELMVKQVNGIYKVRDANIRVRFDQIESQIKKLDSFSISHVLRSLNKRADKLVNICMDSN